MMKYLLGLLSTVVSLLFGAIALADEFTLQATNLPLVQSYKEQIPVELALSTPPFSGDTQQATLTVDDCGKLLELFHNGQPVSQLPLTLTPESTYHLLFMIAKESMRECLLTFSLLDTEKTLLASTSVIMTPACSLLTGTSNNEPSLEDKNSTAEIVDITPTSNELEPTEPIAPSKPSSKPSATPSSKPTKTFTPQPLVTTTSADLDTAFSLLIDKGLLTSADQAKLSQPLTRIAAAEFFVKIALTKGYERDTKKDCSFADMTDATTYDITIARLACEFNIMGIQSNHTPLPEFFPEMTIPSEQLATAFSRLMWRELYENPDTEDYYYQLHMNTLYNLGIIDTITVNSPSTLANFTVIFARTLEKEQFTLDETINADLQCESGDDTSSCDLPKEKRRFRFW
ncbi:MAG: hypothetical protein LBG52_08910 [Candidatus Peribacteria bacterium]|jgi:hypothetical protein|nr:hypothetical protein [Candidatus Peribacteria bacterium]